MITLTETMVAQTAPDAASLKAGRDLANPRKWSEAHASDRAIWGAILGSGSQPYYTTVDLEQLAFHCSCPSRKFPCKHGIGLMFLAVQEPLSTAPEPEWAAKWLDKRRANAATTVQETPENDPDQEKKDKEKRKRADARLAMMETGAGELETLLRDLLRTGFIGIPERGRMFFDQVQRRMVDAKAGGLANYVRNFNRINYLSGAAWHSQAFENATKAWLLLEAFRRMEQQDKPVQDQLKALLGWGSTKKELLESVDTEIIKDQWIVLGKRREETDDRLQMLTIWLYGVASGRAAAFIDYAPSHLPLPEPVLTGTLVKASLAFYPGNLPYRVQFQQVVTTENAFAGQPAFHSDLEAAHRQWADCLARSPWADLYPQLVAQLSPAGNNTARFLKDAAGCVLEISDALGPEQWWKLLAVSGGRPLDLAVLRDGDKLLPLGFFNSNRYQLL